MIWNSVSPSFDADLPLICDDEDLDDSGGDTPEVNPPARMSCFVAAIKLNQILAFALRTIVRLLPLPYNVSDNPYCCSTQRGNQEQSMVTLRSIGKSISLQS